jgi:ankyrin repeat protein
LTWQLSWLGASAQAGSAAAGSASADSASADSATDYSATDYTSGPPSRQFLAAVAAGDITVAARLLAADPGLLYVRDPQGRSAFAIALLAARTGMAELLRENGYLPDVHEAALALDWDRFNALAEEAPGALGRHHAIGGTAMVAAAKGGAGSDIWRVYRWGAVPNPGVGLAASGQEAARQATVTPLSAALDFHHLPTAEMTAASLLANGADPRAPEPLKRSPLHIAAARGSLELVEMLIRKGALLDQVDGRQDPRGPWAGAWSYCRGVATRAPPGDSA